MELWRPVGIYDSDTLIGFAMYGYFPEPAPDSYGWIGCSLIKDIRGKGYGKQAVLSLLDRLHTEYQSGTVYLSVYENNPHAIKLYQQIGFRFNGKYDSKGNISWSIILRDVEPVNGQYVLNRLNRPI